jgi:tetratricopeptide (TPR) repeat protein
MITSPLIAQVNNLPALVKKVDPSILKIYTIDGGGEYEKQGTGVVVAETGICVSNFHVLAGSKKAIVIDYTGRKFDISYIIDFSKEKDLIKFKINNGSLKMKPVFFSPNLISKGMDVFTVGYPNGFEVIGGSTVSTGVVSGFRKIDNQDLIQTSAPITYGSSGGGMFDNKGLLCGVTSGTFASDLKDRHANLNKVISVKDVKSLNRNLKMTFTDFYNAIKNDDYYVKAMELYEEEDFDLAISFFDEHLKLFPEDPISWFRLGNCYNLLAKKDKDIEKFKIALLCFDNSINLDSNYYHPYAQTALVLINLKDTDAALYYAFKALGISPMTGFNNYVVGRVYNERKEWENATDYYTRAIENVNEKEKQNLSQWYLERAIAYSFLKKFTLSENDYKSSIELNPNNLDALFNYGTDLILRNNISSGCYYFKKVAELKPSYKYDKNSISEYIRSYCE